MADEGLLQKVTCVVGQRSLSNGINRTVKTWVQILIAMLLLGRSGQAQGFINLDFEAANVAGYSHTGYNVPTNAAFPGWTAFYSQPGFGTGYTAQVSYDTISMGGADISINDTNTGNRFVPIEGAFSAVLYGGTFQVSSSISQSGMIPNGITTLLVSAAGSGNFTVTVDGQTISMTPLQVFSGYSVYGGDISAFAGQVVPLTFTEPAPPSGPYINVLILDNIQFSSSPVPEPSALALSALGGLILTGLARRGVKKCSAFGGWNISKADVVCALFS